MNPKARRDVEVLVTQYGYTREEAELEVKRGNCEHEFDGTWRHTFMGCTRTCTKCGQMQCDPNHCGQYDASSTRRRRTTSAPVKK